MFLASPEQWTQHLRRLADPRADRDAVLGLGELEAPFRAAACGAPIAPPSAPCAEREVGLWWALVDGRVDVDAVLACPTDGPLLPRDAYRTVEVWTDADLSGLHALWHLARRRQREDWMGRLERARAWHVRHTQPDNATNRPWALHVFLLGPTPECRHYAETLLHNCLAVQGHPAPLAAWILLDAARAIEEATSSG